MSQSPAKRSGPRSRTSARTPGRSGEISLVPGPYVPAQMGEADVQLVAVVTGRDVAQGAGPGPHGRGPEQAGQRVSGGDPRVPRRPETAPGGIEEEVAAHRALPGKHRLDPAGVRTHQHVAVQEITVDQVPALRGRPSPGSATRSVTAAERAASSGSAARTALQPWTSFPGSSTRPSVRNSRQLATDAAPWCQTTGGYRGRRPAQDRGWTTSRRR